MKGGNNWIEVKCKNPVSGKSIKIETTKNTNMCMSNIEIFGLTATATTPVPTPAEGDAATDNIVGLIPSSAKQSSGKNWPAICALTDRKHKTCKKTGTDATWTD